jgi:hypothetical protein
MKRFLAAFGMIMLYMLAIAAVLWPVILLAQDDENAILIVVLGTFVLSIAGFIPYMDWVVKRVFRFEGQGHPLSEAALRAHIHEINGFDVPMVVQERKRKLVATWKIVDARWWELLAKAGLTKIYELHIKFDEARHLVTLIDVSRSVSWRAGPTEVQVGWAGFRGLMSGYEIGEQWGIGEDLELEEIYDYTFSPKEIKTPIMNSILKSGWDVRFGIW